MEVLKKSSLIIFSVLFALFFSEMIVRFFFPQDMTGSHIEYSDRGYILNRNSGTFQHQFGKIIVQYHYYPPHLRDTPIDKNAKHILVMGDSFTFGYLLPWNKTYVYRLQVATDEIFGKSKYQFLQAATGGWGAADYLAYLEDYGEKLSPKFVLVFINTDDLSRGLQEDIFRLADSQSLRLVENFHPFPHSKLKNIRTSFLYNWLLEHVALFQLATKGYAGSRNFLVAITKPKGVKVNNTAVKWIVRVPSSGNDMVYTDEFAIRYGEAIFYRMNEWCKQHHAKLLVFTTGFNAFYPPDLRNPTKIFLSHAVPFFEKERIPYYDIAMPFKKSVEGKVFQFVGEHHPNEFGAQVVAQISWPWIKQQLINNDRLKSGT